MIRCAPRGAACRVVLLVILVVASTQSFAYAQAAAAPADPQPQAPSPIAPRAPAALASEPGFLTSAIDFVESRFGEDGGRRKSGFYPELSNMITGSGWVSAGPGYRQYFADDRALFETSAALSWRLYKMAQARFELPRLANDHLVLGTQAMWQDNTQVSYFGVGPNVSEDDRSQYRLQTHDVVGYANIKPNDSVTISGKAGWLGHPKLMDPGGTFKRDLPSTRDFFPADPAVSLSTQPALLHSEAAIWADTRDYRGHPTRGFLYRAALANYWDRSYEVYTFHAFEAEALHYIPTASERVVLAFHAWTVAADHGDGHDIPIYLLPSLGGSRTLRAYHDYEFHDRNLLVVSAESRFALFTHLDAALFMDAGNVASRYRDLDLDKTSYGAGLRLHTQRTTLARLDMARGAEGWRIVASTSEPLRLPRVRRTVATIPFAP